ncbi:hypothetical protein AVEN_261525-1 [Araneus ventricosus]|uniref:Uncharacterized protein n=1 Tax=Araneus ventricosus TaxID=182803 RepID=A0A4Y2TTG3_ARAVE|nr:hypothetical protein AVEN_261525-1 [Araneus ventricosus]
MILTQKLYICVKFGPYRAKGKDAPKCILDSFPIRVRTHAAVAANSTENWKRVGGVHTGRLATRRCRVALHIRLLRPHSAFIIRPMSEIRGSEMVVYLNE